MNNPITITGLTTEKCSSFEYPCLHIENSNGDKSYLMLFRFTHMQMCGTPDGERSKGESTFRSIKFVKCDEEYLYIAICESINCYMRYVYGAKDNPVIRYTYKGNCYRSDYSEKWDKKEVEGYFAIEDFPLISDFVKQNIELVKNYYKVA